MALDRAKVEELVRSGNVAELQKLQSSTQSEFDNLSRPRGGGGGFNLRGALAGLSQGLAGKPFSGGGTKPNTVSELIALEKFRTQQGIDADAQERANKLLSQPRLQDQVSGQVQPDSLQPSLADEEIISSTQTPASFQRSSLSQLADKEEGLQGIQRQPIAPQDLQEPTVVQTEIETPSLSEEQKQKLTQPGATSDDFTIQQLIRETQGIPLFLSGQSESIDSTGKLKRTTTTKANPLVLKFLESKLARQGKLEDAEQKILNEGRAEISKNTRSLDAVAALLQNTVSVWKAATREKSGIPNIPLPGGRESALLKSTIGSVADALDITGFSATKAFEGQRIETAMALSKIITGSSRIIKSVVNKLLKTLPEDTGIFEDMEFLVAQSLANSASRAIGRELTEEERADLQERTKAILAVPEFTLPEGAEERKIALDKFAPTSKRFSVNGRVFNIPIDKVAEFINTIDEDDTVLALD